MIDPKGSIELARAQNKEYGEFGFYATSLMKTPGGRIYFHCYGNIGAAFGHPEKVGYQDFWTYTERRHAERWVRENFEGEDGEELLKILDDIYRENRERRAKNKKQKS